MKRKIFNRLYIVTFIAALLISANSSNAQDIDMSKYRMLYSFSTVKQHDNSRLLEVKFTARNKKDRKDKFSIFEAEIEFINYLNDQEVLLGTVKTSKEGIAILTIPEAHNYLTDKEGNINLKARFNGTEAMRGKEEEIIVKNLHLELDLIEKDSIRKVLVKKDYSYNSQNSNTYKFNCISWSINLSDFIYC